MKQMKHVSQSACLGVCRARAKEFGCVEDWTEVTPCRRTIAQTRRTWRACSETQRCSWRSCCWPSSRCCWVCSLASFCCSRKHTAACYSIVTADLFSSVHCYPLDNWPDSFRTVFTDSVTKGLALCLTSAVVMQHSWNSRRFCQPDLCRAMCTLYSNLSGSFSCKSKLHFAVFFIPCLLLVLLIYAAALLYFCLCSLVIFVHSFRFVIVQRAVYSIVVWRYCCPVSNTVNCCLLCVQWIFIRCILQI